MRYATKFRLAVLCAGTVCLSIFGLPAKSDVLVKEVVKIPRDQTIAIVNSEGLLVDPISGTVKGSLDSYGTTRDLDGQVISARHFKGFLVMDPITKLVKGSIDQDGYLIKLDLSSIGNTLTIVRSPSSYIIDPISGQIIGFIDASGSRFDISGAVLPATSNTAYAVVNSKSEQLEGFINNGRLISLALNLPDDVYRRTTIVTSSRNGQTSQTTTTTTTTTIPSTAVITRKFVLPATDTFVAVNPLTGEVIGIVDPATLLVHGYVVPSGSLIIDKNTGFVSAVVNPTGELVAINLVPLNDTFAASINSQRVELSRIIASQVSTGRLSTEKAVQMQAMLDKIPSSVEINNLTYYEALPVIDTLRSVRGRLTTVAHIEPTMPNIGWGFVIEEGQLKWVDDIAFRRMELDSRIDDQFVAGHINSVQRDKLKEQMSRIAALENSYRLHGNGSFTHQESRTLFVDYDRVGSELDHYIAVSRRSTVGIR